MKRSARAENWMWVLRPWSSTLLRAVCVAAAVAVFIFALLAQTNSIRRWEEFFIGAALYFFFLHYPLLVLFQKEIIMGIVLPPDGKHKFLRAVAAIAGLGAAWVSSRFMFP